MDAQRQARISTCAMALFKLYFCTKDWCVTFTGELYAIYLIDWFTFCLGMTYEEGLVALVHWHVLWFKRKKNLVHWLCGNCFCFYYY